MTRQLPSLPALRSFEAAARHLSFTRAAVELAVTQGAVSRAVAALEAELGVALFRRGPGSANGRRLALTEAGAAYLPDLTRALDLVAEATLRLAPARHRVAVNAWPTIAMRWLTPRLPAFHAAHPDIELAVTTHDRRIDLRAEPYDLSIERGVPEDWPDCSAIWLMADEVLPVWSPAYQPGGRPIEGAEDLRRATLIRHATRPGNWRDWAALAGLDGLEARGPAFEHMFLVLEAALGAMGVALVSPFAVEQEVASGRLRADIPVTLRTPGGYYALHRPDPAPATRALARWLARQE